ncbi:5'-nucleotidase family protein in cluster with NagD-like phosphatase [Alkalibacterium sp. AK22]|uniref:bifunctional metallophosphatase/5'-nucleotidase n=1 Tax=Alkalibacterium sp. AK22 TaxID=1229520 RepID=UPI00045111C8|nr:bifunctional metallophosphatase/5'-nucleotidase [Alkalibacterium sp. AK22]EXJ22925.1 5'-nucleotidase family protein in cluster with NagD-like phosphatase [Alkalibacterium sp. AK22]
MDKITIYHTNDLHAQLTYWPRIAAYLTGQKQQHQSSGETVFIFDCGDATDRIHPLVEATNGKAVASLLQQGSYDAVTIGNNEGIGNTKEQLNDLFTTADYSVVVSNIVDKDTGQRPSWAEQIKILKTQDKRSLALIGCTIPLPMSYDSLGWDIEDPLETIGHLIEAYHEKVDGFILLSHLGLDTDRKIAALYPEILVIMGGHTHHLLPEGETVANTLIAGAGKFGSHIGKITFSLDGNQSFNARAQVIDVKNELQPVHDEAEKEEQRIQAGLKLLSQKTYGRLASPLMNEWTKEPNLISITLEAMRIRKSDSLAAINSGLFLQSLPEGVLNHKELHKSLPHPMRLVEITLSGSDLLLMLEQMDKQKDRLRHLKARGYGFRGKVFGQIFFSGIEKQAAGWTANQKIVQKEQVYHLITVDYFLFVPYFPVLQKQSKVRLISSDFLRDIVGGYVSKYYARST